MTATHDLAYISLEKTVRGTTTRLLQLLPTDANANIPYMNVDLDTWGEKKKNFRLVPNSEFTLRVKALVESKGLSKDSPIVLICRSGSRSAKAAKILDAAGYKQVYTVVDGFEGDKAKDGPNKGQRVVNGWKNAGRPWSYKLVEDSMYWDLRRRPSAIAGARC